MANDNNFSLTIVTSLVIFLTYYILVISIFTGSVQSAATSNNNNLDANSNLQEVAQQQQPLQLGGMIQHQRNRRFRPLSGVSNYGLTGKYFQLPKSQLQQQQQQQKVPIDFELLIDEDEFLNEQNSIEKRFDDYGHLRFGKRGTGGVNGGNGDQFDDYGHLRFGRSLDF